MKRNFLPIILILIGIILVGDMLLENVIDSKIIGYSILIIFGLYFLFRKSFVLTAILLFFGIDGLLKHYLNFKLFNSKFFFPVLIIILGIIMILNNSKKITKSKKTKEKEIVLFSGKNIQVHPDQDYISVTSMFGGAEIHVSENRSTDLYIDVECIFGGIDIYTNDAYNIENKGTVIFGGVENKVKNGKIAPTINVNYNIIFGGLEIER